MSRRKQPALAVPAGADEALELIENYVSAERVALDLRLRAESTIDRIKGDRDAVLVALEAEQKVRFAGLKAWWEAGGKELAKAKRSAELGGATIGVRLTPPKVKFGKGHKEKDVLLWLSGLGSLLAGTFIRRKPELDKAEIVKRLPHDGAVQALFGARLSVVQSDEFFIDAGLDADALRAAAAATNQTTPNSI